MGSRNWRSWLRIYALKEYARQRMKFQEWGCKEWWDGGKSTVYKGKAFDEKEREKSF